jgi:hypothetical protein
MREWVRRVIPALIMPDSRRLLESLVEAGLILTDRIIGLAIEMHRALGPGLPEAVHHHCLCWELQRGGASSRDLEVGC